MTGVFPLRPVLKDYHWGSISAIPGLLGIEPPGLPLAELWLGAHGNSPSLIGDGLPLDEYLAGGKAEGGRYAGQLPFLMKILAAASPVSIQVHPNRTQAAEGFAREAGGGLSPKDPARNYRDPHHKPEILVALTPFSALCGLREASDSALLLRDLLGARAGRGVAARLLAHLDDGDLSGAVDLLLSGDPAVPGLASLMARLADERPGPLTDTLTYTSSHHGADPGVVVGALLNRADLAPGEAVFVEAGQLHAHLRGVGVEVMAPSDNVLRGGLTRKRIDAPELRRIGVFDAHEPTILRGDRHAVRGLTVTSYRPHVEEFEVHRLEVAGPGACLALGGFGLAIATKGSVRFSSGQDQLTVPMGGCVFLDTSDEVSVDGSGEAYLTTSPGLSVRETSSNRL
ncbi:mannose-6-phosphate isomerase, class I [Tessaracoccus caeni]|uniref:mannose-6-phosphate isomerase, class I n=1 Tax=Tessaracoccus caeni TaxID=3031239 RepID=UPI0023DA370A|nr:mannose-6-phosphate isomerase, class I [Tessaracoccus caeni]MDF1487022.1 mannose-6-phosphate isomerase, class I [Tessaracoccus caeni]